jgi:hypothetical protein
MVSIAPALTSLRELLETPAKLPAPAVRFVDKADEVGHKPADEDLPGIGFGVRARRGGGSGVGDRGGGVESMKELMADILGVLDTIKQRPHAMRVTDDEKLENLVTRDAFGNRLRGQDQYMVRLIGRGLWLTPKGPGNYTEDPEDAYLMTGFEAERYIRGNSNLEAISYESYEKRGLRSDRLDPRDSEGTPLREGDYIIRKAGSFGPSKRTGFGLRADNVYAVKSLYEMSGITYVNAWPITPGRTKTVNPAVMFTKITDDEVRALEK